MRIPRSVLVVALLLIVVAAARSMPQDDSGSDQDYRAVVVEHITRGKRAKGAPYIEAETVTAAVNALAEEGYQPLMMAPIMGGDRCLIVAGR